MHAGEHEYSHSVTAANEHLGDQAGDTTPNDEAMDVDSALEDAEMDDIEDDMQGGKMSVVSVCDLCQDGEPSSANERVGRAGYMFYWRYGLTCYIGRGKCSSPFSDASGHHRGRHG